MTVRTENLLRVFGAENTMPFSVWTYSTPDPLEEVLAPGYFRGCYRGFRLGDLLFCASDETDNRYESDGKRDRRRALLMVTSMHIKAIETRLVQDWGSPERPAAAPTGRRRKPARRWRQPSVDPAMPHRRRALRPRATKEIIA